MFTHGYVAIRLNPELVVNTLVIEIFTHGYVAIRLNPEQHREVVSILVF